MHGFSLSELSSGGAAPPPLFFLVVVDLVVLELFVLLQEKCLSLHVPGFFPGNSSTPPGVKNNKCKSLLCEPSVKHCYVISISNVVAKQTFI